MEQQQDEILKQLQQDLANEQVVQPTDGFWGRFMKEKRAKWALYALCAVVMVAFLSSFLANELPLYAKYKGESFYPAFSSKKKYELADGEKISVNYTNWKLMDLESVVWAPITYSPNKTDKHNGYLNARYKAPNGEQQFKTAEGEVVELPKRFWHWMGTSRRGEDVFAIMIHGSKTALWVGLLASIIATIIGVVLGLTIGYYGDGLKLSKAGIVGAVVGTLPAIFYSFTVRSFILLDASRSDALVFWGQFIFSLLLFFAIQLLFYQLGKGIGRLLGVRGSWKFPLDTLVIKTIEIKTAIPGVVLILALLAIFTHPSMWHLVFIIGFTGWGGIARIARAEVLRIRSLEYIEAAKALGVGEGKIVFKHILLNSLGPVLVITAFSSAGAILVEASLSFLGIGTPGDVASWGGMLSSGKENFNAWWLVVFPGLAIFAVVMIFNLIGEGVRDALDPKVKS